MNALGAIAGVLGGIFAVVWVLDRVSHALALPRQKELFKKGHDSSYSDTSALSRQL